jgi:hypothetical protein
MTITVNTKSYDLDNPKTFDSIRYNGPDHTLTVKDYLDTKRVAAKPTATFAGQGKASCKLTRTLTDGTDIVGDALVEISVSFPVASSATEQQTMITDLAVWMATTSADSLFKDHDINQ